MIVLFVGEGAAATGGRTGDTSSTGAGSVAPL